MVLIDTAGLRRRSKVEESLEYYSVIRTLRAVDRSNVTVALIDATEGSLNRIRRSLVTPMRAVRA